MKIGSKPGINGLELFHTPILVLKPDAVGKLFINLKVYKGLLNILHFRDFTRFFSRRNSVYNRLKSKKIVLRKNKN